MNRKAAYRETMIEMHRQHMKRPRIWKPSIRGNRFWRRGPKRSRTKTAWADLMRAALDIGRPSGEFIISSIAAQRAQMLTEGVYRPIIRRTTHKTLTDCLCL